ncbi:hypothetical protein OkiPb00243_49410 [Escherichia coli]
MLKLDNDFWISKSKIKNCDKSFWMSAETPISLKPTLRDGSELETSYKLTLEQQDCIRSCQNTLTVIAVQSLQTNNF